MAARKLAVPYEEGLWQAFKKQSIQQAVVRLMCREGLDSVTMDRVAQEAGIAKGTIYLHYRDKQELLDDVKQSALEPMVAKVVDILQSDAAPERKLQSYSLRYLTYFDERRDLFRILLYERQVTRVQGKRYQSDRYRRLLDGTAAAIRDGIRLRVFRETDADAVAAMFVDANMAVMNQRLLSESPRPVEDDAQLIADLFIRGLKLDATSKRRSAR